LWYVRAGIGFALGGGVIMLIVAAAVYDSSSFPLLAIGGWWLLTGLAAIRLYGRQAQEIILDGSTVEFRSSAGRLTIPATEILGVGRPWWDPRRMAYVRFRTHSEGVIKAAPRLQGFVEFLIELRLVNPAVRVGTL
jgi:hypothetical protein